MSTRDFPPRGTRRRLDEDISGGPAAKEPDPDRRDSGQGQVRPLRVDPAVAFGRAAPKNAGCICLGGGDGPIGRPPGLRHAEVPPMNWLAIAESALKHTRGLLKPSLKAGNKGYVLTDGEKAQQLAKHRDAGVDIAAKWDGRNAKRQLAFDKKKARGNIVNVANLSVLDAGGMLYNAALIDPREWYGNCGEQASVALFLCNQAYHAGPDNLFLITYMHKHSTFSHSHVILGDSQLINAHRGRATLASASVKEPGTQTPAAADRREIATRFLNEVAFCDPWLNVACLAKDYPARARQMLDKWTDEGKRLHEREHSPKSLLNYFFDSGPALEKTQHWWMPNGADVDKFWEGTYAIFGARDVPTWAGS